MRRVGLMLSLVSCGPAVQIDGESSSSSADATSTSTATSVGSTIGTTTTSDTATSTSTSTTGITTVGDVTTSTDEESDDGRVFIFTPDGGPCLTHCTFPQCDPWSQDCREGFKCAPWANDGGDLWNATACREIDRTPAQPGDPCTIDGGPASGVDDCDIANMCWDVDPDTGFGTCVPFCGGSEANPTCEGDTSCWIADEGVPILCLPTCDPLAPACGDGLSCVVQREEFFCMPSEHVVQEYAAPCDDSIGCGTGLVCANASAIPMCDLSCCTALCDLAAPTCPDEAAGQTCVAYFERGQAPEGLENLGACLIE